MTEQILLIGAAAAALFAGYAVFGVARGRAGLSVLHVVLAVVALAALFAGLLLAGSENGTETILDAAALQTAVLAGGIGLAVFGMALALVERRRGSAVQVGPLVSVVGGLAVLLAVVAPMVGLAAMRNATPVAAPDIEPRAKTSVEVASASVFPTNTPLPPTPEPASGQNVAAQDVLLPLPTRYVMPTAAPDEALPDEAACAGVVDQNLNLRAGPDTAYDILVTIPASTIIDVFAQNAEHTWLRVRYQAFEGWVSAPLVRPEGDCAPLPIQTP